MYLLFNHSKLWFGKYKGSLVKDILKKDRDYLLWLEYQDIARISSKEYMGISEPIIKKKKTRRMNLYIYRKDDLDYFTFFSKNGNQYVKTYTTFLLPKGLQNRTVRDHLMGWMTELNLDMPELSGFKITDLSKRIIKTTKDSIDHDENYLDNLLEKYKRYIRN